LQTKRRTPPGSDNDSQLFAARAFCELIPGAASLWSRNRSFCVLNESAIRLFKYPEAEFIQRSFLWFERIHPEDREKYSQFIEQLGKSKSTVLCDYRFFPRGAHTPTWIRETSSVREVGIENAGKSISTYIDISDLKSDASAENNPSTEIVQSVVHELQNRIQKITMELELAHMESKGKLSVDDIVCRIRRSLQDLGDQLASMREGRALQDLYTILNDVVLSVRKDLKRQNVNLKLIRREPLPLVPGNKGQLHDAFEQVLGCCGSMLKHGGNLEVKAQQREVGGQIFAEVKVTSSSASSIVDSVNSEQYSERHRIKLGMTLAAEILRRHRGQVHFDKESRNLRKITVLIQASPA
jgi:hypothetical protein